MTDTGVYLNDLLLKTEGELKKSLAENASLDERVRQLEGQIGLDRIEHHHALAASLAREAELRKRVSELEADPNRPSISTVTEAELKEQLRRSSAALPAMPRLRPLSFRAWRTNATTTVGPASPNEPPSRPSRARRELSDNRMVSSNRSSPQRVHRICLPATRQKTGAVRTSSFAPQEEVPGGQVDA